LIRAYQNWKGTNYVPELTHPALKWSAKYLLPLLPVVTDACTLADHWKETIK
jgi:hypothetical protein